MSEKIEKFEDFVAWQKARLLTAGIYSVTSQSVLQKTLGLKTKVVEPLFQLCRISRGF